jgi:hypothetical protein
MGDKVRWPSTDEIINELKKYEDEPKEMKLLNNMEGGYYVIMRHLLVGGYYPLEECILIWDYGEDGVPERECAWPIDMTPNGVFTSPDTHFPLEESLMAWEYFFGK